MRQAQKKKTEAREPTSTDAEKTKHAARHWFKQFGPNIDL